MTRLPVRRERPEDVAERHARGPMPVDINRVAADMGLATGFAPLGGRSGVLRRGATTEAPWQAFVEGSATKHHRRFALARLIGHFVHHRFLDQGSGILVDSDRQSGLGPEADEEACRFAIDLLMPETAVLKNWDGSNLTALARALDVTEAAAMARVEMLGLQPEPSDILLLDREDSPSPAP